MNTIVISRNIHPYERGAFYLAEEVHRKIKNEGFDSHLLTVPYNVTTLCFLKRLYRGQVSEDELKRWNEDNAINWLLGKVEQRWPSSVHFDFHNSQLKSLKGPEDIPIRFSRRVVIVLPSGLENIDVFPYPCTDTFPHSRKDSYVIESPAIYRMPSRKRIDEFNELSRRGYYNLINVQEKEMVDVRRTREDGWMDEVLRDRIVEWMLKFVTVPTYSHG